MEGHRVSGAARATGDRFARAERALAAIGTTLDARRTAGELAAFLVAELCESATVDLFVHQGAAEPGETAGLGKGARSGAPVAPLGTGPAQELAGSREPSAPPVPFRSREVAETAESAQVTEAVQAVHAVRAVEPAAGLRAPAGAAARDGDLRRVAVAGRRDLLDSLEKIPREDVSVRALDAGHPITASFTPGEGTDLVALSVPLLAWGRVHGVALALRTGRLFADDETAAVHYAARLAAAHLRHAEEYREAGDRVSGPRRVPPADPGRPHPHLDLATRYLPVGAGTPVGGDWCESVRLRHGRTLLVIGDVMGHGLDAAVDMNAYRSMLRYLASTDLPPHRVLRRVDAAMAEESGRRPATCLLALLDPARGTAALAGAGHPPPAVFHRDGTAELVRLPVGPPLGTGLGGHEAARLSLAQDDTLVLFTDGLVERRGEDIDTSLDRLAALRVRPGADAAGLLDEILDRLGARRADDDVAVVAARVRPCR
ncbi:PP2C family protein-serine/threonine phosphatase [Streptomyces sp. NPDC004065]|uniref:PP2C family protein-serine/threonine phosphatase n=1 Tax=Streptomyces sp. NPDC004065 TaxID=3364689 RepID=UPI00384C89C1